MTDCISRKHGERHETPYQCDIPGCPRQAGFRTQNDLDRHRESLHGVVLPHDTTFRCVGVNCPKPGKQWPRLDNFKSHCQRMHASEDIDDLIKRFIPTIAPRSLWSSPDGIQIRAPYQCMGYRSAMLYQKSRQIPLWRLTVTDVSASSSSGPKDQ